MASLDRDVRVVARGGKNNSGCAVRVIRWEGYTQFEGFASVVLFRFKVRYEGCLKIHGWSHEQYLQALRWWQSSRTSLLQMSGTQTTGTKSASRRLRSLHQELTHDARCRGHLCAADKGCKNAKL